MRFLVCQLALCFMYATTLVSCAHLRPTTNPTTKIAYTIAPDGMGVHLAGGVATVVFPVTDDSAVQREVASSAVYLTPRYCPEHCGVFIKLRYNASVQAAEYDAALTYLLQVFAVMGVPLYVRPMYDSSLIGTVDLIADIYIGVVEPLQP